MTFDQLSVGLVIIVANYRQFRHDAPDFALDIRWIVVDGCIIELLQVYY